MASSGSEKTKPPTSARKNILSQEDGWSRKLNSGGKCPVMTAPEMVVVNSVARNNTACVFHASRCLLVRRVSTRWRPSGSFDQ